MDSTRSWDPVLVKGGKRHDFVDIGLANIGLEADSDF